MKRLRYRKANQPTAETNISDEGSGTAVMDDELAEKLKLSIPSPCLEPIPLSWPCQLSHRYSPGLQANPLIVPVMFDVRLAKSFPSVAASEAARGSENPGLVKPRDETLVYAAELIAPKVVDVRYPNISV